MVRGSQYSARLQLEVQVLHVGESHLLQTADGAAAVLEADLLECFGRDSSSCWSLAPTSWTSRTDGVAGRQGNGQVPDAVLVGRPDDHVLTQPSVTGVG